MSFHRSEVTGSNGCKGDYQNHRSKVTGVVDAVGTPNNPDIRLLNLEDTVLSSKHGQDLDFTSYQVPGSVVSHVDCALWTNRLNKWKLVQPWEGNS